MHETVSLKPTEPNSTLLACRLVCWLRSVFTLTRPRKAHHIVLRRRATATARSGLRVVPIAANAKQGMRRPRNKSSPVR